MIDISSEIQTRIHIQSYCLTKILIKKTVLKTGLKLAFAPGSTVLVQNPTVARLGKKFNPVFMKLACFHTAYLLAIFRALRIQPTPSRCINLTSILILFSHLRLDILLDFPTSLFYALLTFPVVPNFPAIWLEQFPFNLVAHQNLIKSALQIVMFLLFQSSPSFCPHILLSTFSSDVLNVCSSTD